MSKKPAKKPKKIFVIDTSVLLHDHNSITNFEEHHVAIPITVLEELDNFKVGNDTKNFEARECIRIIDRLSKDFTLNDWIPLDNGFEGMIKILLNKKGDESLVEHVFSERKNDHTILNAALRVQQEAKGAQVVLVTKDINLRLKAKAFGFIHIVSDLNCVNWHLIHNA